MKSILWQVIMFVVTVSQQIVDYNICEEILGIKNKKYRLLYYLIPITAYNLLGLILNLPSLSGYSLLQNILLTVNQYIFIAIFLNGGFFKKWFVLLLVWVLSVFPQIILMFILTFGFGYNIETISGEWSSIWLFFCAVAMPLYYILSRIAIGIVKGRKPQFPKNHIWAVTAFAAVMITIGIIIYPSQQIIISQDVGLKTATVWFAFATVLMAVAVCVYFIYSKRLARSKIQLIASENKLKEQYRRMDEIKEQEQQIRKIRHDYKNHITLGLELLNENKIDEAKKYFSQYLDQGLTQSRQFLNTNYELVNAVVNRKLTECFDSDIKVSAAMSCELGNVSEADLCIVLFNLLDNAIEECLKAEKQSEIKLDIYQNKAYIDVCVSNTLDHSVLETNPELITSKTDKKEHGLGISIIKDICKKYNGIFFTEEKDDVFIADTWLQNK